MKKKVISVLLILLCFCVGGCMPMSRGKQLTRVMDSEQQISDRVMEEIAVALDAGDAEQLKAMFSEAALIEFSEWAKEEAERSWDDEMPDLDEQIAGIIAFYQGKMVSYEGLASSSTSNNYGVVVKELVGRYTLETDKETYQVMYQYKPIDDEDQKEIGLRKLQIVTKKTYDEEGFKWNFFDKGPGVYWQTD